MQTKWSYGSIVKGAATAGVVATLLVALTRGMFAQGTTSVNLIEDPGFETTDSGFYPQDHYGTVERTTEQPIDGTASLRIGSDGWGTAMWWSHEFRGKAARLAVSAHLRSNLESGSNLNFCAIVYYDDWSTVEECTPVNGAAGDKGVVNAAVEVDPARYLMWVNIRMYQEGSDALSISIDNADARLDIVEQPPSTPAGGGSGGNGGGGSGGSGGGSGGGNNACTPSPNSVYQPISYPVPQARPFLPLTDYTQGGPNTAAGVRVRAAADAAIAGNAPYAFAPKMSLLAYRLTNDQRYLLDAIARVDAMVEGFEASIANGEKPAIASDSYLEVGWYIENIAFVYDHAFEQLTPEQRQRWKAIADQSIKNLWDPANAEWGGNSFPWSGWSVCDPGNNYHFSFLRATMAWGWASQNQEMLNFLQTQKFPPLLDYYAALPGGGTREGTGYGGAVGNLLGNYIFWKTATGQDLSAITPHPKETIDYWVHATVPTMDRFAPIADLSRESIPNLYDYHENLVHQAVVLNSGTPQARRGTWWLQNNSVNGVAHVFNIAGDLLAYPDQPEQPSELMYHSPGAGALFARSSWDENAAWVSLIAGKYDQSHAHHDQGSFTFFKNDWLAVTNNIWSYSGLHLEDEAHNVLRFERADGSVIPQNPSDAVASSMTATVTGNVTSVSADLSNAFSANTALVHGWTRSIELSEHMLKVTDTCQVADGIRPVFQVQVPVAPVVQQDGSILAGNLRIVSLLPVTAVFRETNAAEFTRGHRVELTSAQGCSFNVELHALESPAPNPGPGPNPGPTPTPGPAPGPIVPAPIPTAIVNSTDPVAAVWSEAGPAQTRIKSPAQHMRFTAGAPFRILADARDPNAWMCPPGHPPYVCAGTMVRFYVDGQLVGSATPSTTDANLWEMRLSSGLPAGDHVLTVQYVPYDPSTGSGGTAIDGLAPVTVHVDPAPAHATVVSLTEDLVLAGSDDLNWTDATVIGNGYSVTAAAGYSGDVVIDNAMVMGLGGFGERGIDVTTTGSIAVTGSIFEATGAIKLGAQGASPFILRNNEMRANNLLTFVASNPDVPVMLELVGQSTGEKAFQGNRLGAGILRVRGDQWQIGGLAAGEGNVLIGPRVVLELVDSSNSIVQGNYLRHDYHGGFSQGFNLAMWGSSENALIEHNVIRGGSWPVSNVGGEFRYNLVADSGHNFWRGARSNTQIHHNVFAHTSGANTGFEGVFKFYGGETAVSIHNNTFDVAGAISGFDGPVLNIGAASQVASVRNSLFVGFRNVSGYGGAFLGAPEGAVSQPRIGSADYNGWFNPLAPNSPHYLPGIVDGTAGANDLQGDPQFSAAAEIPYRIAEGCLWLGNCSTGQVLARYRALYLPAAGSPVLGAGDPADGAGTPIGAVGRDGSHPLDRFGRIVP